MGFTGIDPLALEEYGEKEFKPNLRGEAVRLKCPKKGALTDIEFEAFQDYLLHAYEKGDVDLEDMALLMMLSQTGRRPSQIADMQLLDIEQLDKASNFDGITVSIPRRKQQQGGSRLRGSFKPFALNPEHGQCLMALRDDVSRRIRNMAPGVTEEQIKKFPLFPAWKIVKNLSGNVGNLVDIAESSDRLHRTTKQIADAVLWIMKKLSVPSERTGLLRLTPTRLRRTLATRAAREGYGVLVIAELLDHSDTQSARVYTEEVSENVIAIDAAVNLELTPIAQAFSGLLIDKEEQAIRAGDKSSRIRSSSGVNVGSCGQHSFCGATAPISCYTCKNFQPWLDAPHDQLLTHLLEERVRIKSITGDDQIASVNDRTILAIAHVVELCAKRRKAIEGAPQ